MSPVGRALRDWLAGSIAAVAGVAGIGFWPTLRLAPERATTVIATGCGVALGGALLGALPVLRAVAQAERSQPLGATVRAMALRFGGTLVGGLAVALGSELPRRPLVIWIGLAYGALLVVETMWMARWLRAGTR